MLKYQKKGIFKALSVLLAVAMLLAAPIGTIQAYALEGEQPAVTDIESDPSLVPSEGSDSNEVLDSGTPPEEGIPPADASQGEDGTPPVAEESKPATPPDASAMQSRAVLPLSSDILVSTEDELETALTSVENGGTIKLTDNITYPKGIVVDGKSFTLDVENYILDVKVNAPAEAEVKGLEVKNHGDISLAGTGQFNIDLTGANTSKGVYCDNGSSATVSNVKVTVMADSSSAFGVYTNGAGSSIMVLGDVWVINPSGGGCGAKTWSSGEIRIEGTITASNYINLNSVYKAKDSGEVDGDYLKYSAVKDGPGIVWVKNTSAPSGKACEIDGTQYDTLDLALAEADDGETITLLDSIAYESSVAGGAIVIRNMALTFDLNGHDLTIHNPSGVGLMVENSADVTVCGAGEFTIDSKFAALNVAGSSTFTTEGDVIATLESSNDTGIYAIASTVNIVKGSITATGDGIYTAGANTKVYFRGPITVNGEAESNAHGVHLNGTDNTVEVSSAQGTINVTGGRGSGIYVESGGTVTVGGSETPARVTSINEGIMTLRNDNKATVTVYGDVTGGKNAINAFGDAEIKVVGNVTSTAEAKRAVCAINSFADAGDEISITITGNVEGPGGVNLYGNSGTTSNTVAITGDVIATGTGNETAGVYASYGSVAVKGDVTAPSSLGAGAGANGQITIDGVLSGEPYIKVNNEPKTASDKDATTTKEGYHTYSDQVAKATVWVKEGAPAVQYQLTVQTGGNGTASANVNSAAQNTQIALTAAPNSGYHFKEWQVVSGGVSIANNKFIMPAENVTIKAIFEPIPAAFYNVTVNGSHAVTTGAGSYAQGATVTINAGARSGYSFTGWTSSDGVIFASAGSATTTFTMPAKNMTVTATWSYNGGSGNDSGGGGSSSAGSGTTITNTPEKKPDQPVTAAVHVAATAIANGSASATISDKTISGAIARAHADAKAQGKTANGLAISVTVSNPASTKPLGIVLTRAVLKQLTDAKVRQLEIDAQLLTMGLNQAALREIQRQSTGDVTITVKPAMISGIRNTCDIAISYVKDGKTVNITSPGNGSVTLSLPYTPGKNEAVGGLYAVYVDGKGKATRIAGSAYDANSRSILFTADHFRIYGVGYTAPSAKFTDISTHWGKESIDYVVGRGLLSGTSKTTFAPDTAMTRGVLAAALGRLARVDAKSYTANSFTDVKTDNTFRPYIEWAYKKGIMQGIGNGRFAPERAVTREEMAVISENYAKTTGYKLPVTRVATTYADAYGIGSSYKTAVKVMQQAGIMMGEQNNKFNPKASATRAEVSAMLHRYIKLTIAPATAQGWAKNDDGQHLYYKNGKALTGTQTIGGVKYFFGTSGVLKAG